jgi:hypothetical protein
MSRQLAFEAATDLAANTVVALGTTSGRVTVGYPANNTTVLLGVVVYDVLAGKQATVQTDGVVLAKAAGAIAGAVAVNANTSGLLIAADATENTIGQTVSAASAANDLIQLYISPALRGS